MPTNVIYPKVSLENAPGKISHWLVSEGETVRRGQVLFEIENDKAAVEVEAPSDGVVRTMIPAGTEVDVGSQVALIYALGEAEVASELSTTVAQKVLRSAMPAVAEQVRAAPELGPRPTPLARRIARDQNIRIEDLTGTGPRGRIQRKDVLNHLAKLALTPSAANVMTSMGTGLHHVWLRKGNGFPLVMLHGFAGDLNNWRGLFAGSRFDGSALALDLPAHGLSPLAVPADFDGLVDVVEQTIAGLISGPMVLVGHSFGGTVAARITARGVLDLHGLCLFAPGGLGPEINAAFIDGILRACEASSLLPWLNELVHDRAIISDAFLKAVVEQRLNQGLTDAMRNFANRFLPDGTQSVAILDDLARINLPIRVIFGHNDRILPFARTAGLPGHVALHALHNCGHMPHIEHPKLSLHIISELLRSA